MRKKTPGKQLEYLLTYLPTYIRIYIQKKNKKN